MSRSLDSLTRAELLALAKAFEREHVAREREEKAFAAKLRAPTPDVTPGWLSPEYASADANWSEAKSELDQARADLAALRERLRLDGPS